MIKLQFRWMPESKKPLNPRRAVEIEDNSQGLIQEIESYSRPADTPVSIRSGGGISIARSGSSRAVLSGDILNIEMPFEKGLKMKKNDGFAMGIDIHFGTVWCRRCTRASNLTNRTLPTTACWFITGLEMSRPE